VYLGFEGLFPYIVVHIIFIYHPNFIFVLYIICVRIYIILFIFVYYILQFVKWLNINILYIQYSREIIYIYSMYT
jgi:hypothetical protein